MGKKHKQGICKLCGRDGPLTFEHVPPRSAFNDIPVRVINGEEALKSVTGDSLPWDYSEMRGKVQQQGQGGYYLCRACNERTGSWYVPHYERFIRGVFSVVSSVYQNNELFSCAKLHAESIRPLPIFKEIMVMFCDINHGCFGDKNLRSFLMEKDSAVPFDSKKYRVFCYIAKGPVFRTNGLSVSCVGFPSESPKIIQMSEISSIPLGFALYINLPDGYIPEGCELTEFSQYKYEDTAIVDMVLPVLESNILFSGDYRKKDEICNPSTRSKSVD